MARAGRAAVERDFREQHVAQSLVELYETLR
jgi:hypothetical protein